MPAPTNPPPSAEKRSPLFVIGAVAAVYLLGIVGIIAGVLLAGGDGSGSSSESASSTVDISLTEFKISGNLTVPAGRVVLNVKNDGTIPHNLSVPTLEKKTADLAGGTTESLDLGELEPGTYEILCEIAGHKDSGMQATLTVNAPGAAAVADGGSSSNSDHVMTDAEATAIDEKMMAQMKTFATDAVATEGAGNTLMEPTILPDGTKEFALTSEIVDWEVEPGKVVKAWAYNGQVPGPWIKVNLGDKVSVKLTNKLQMATDIHFHGVHTPNSFDGVSPYTQTQIKKGETFNYEFVADKPAVGMYHAHMHGEEAVPNGMFGVFQVGDVPLPTGRTVSGVTVPKDLKIVDEIPMVLNDAGVIGYSLNGKSFPSTAPVVVKQGDWFVVNYFNEGLQNHPMHMHGFPQLIVAKDGIPLDQPYWADTILIGPGERYSVAVNATDLGTWVWHCHILNHVEMKDRLFGMATAVVVQDPAAA